MANSDGPPRRRRSRPATTPEGREQYLASLAYDLVEKRLREGTATSQETTYFLKAGSRREELERQRIEHENELSSVKIAAIASEARQEAIYLEALNAMRTYSGHEPVEEYDDYVD